MTQEHLHLALNPLPFLGTGISLIPTMVGVVLRSKATLITGLANAAVCGWVTPIVMATGEYVSVSSQTDTERGDFERERGELANDHDLELAELTAIYVVRGLDAELAHRVDTQLMAHDALSAHARDKLGISDTLSARPIQASLASAGAFAVGAALPLLLVFIVPRSALV